MNWFRPIGVCLYRFAAGLHKQGISNQRAELENLPLSAVFCWHSLYSSVVSMMGDEDQGYGAVDGMNEKGLVVNALYDTPATYAKPEPYFSDGNISILRWPQYILDSFASVDEVAGYAESNSLRVLEEAVPEGGAAEGLVPGTVHVAVSDRLGNSLIIEFKNGELICYKNPEYRVVTNEPDYATQLEIMKYWQYLWGQTKPAITEPNFTVPGGTSPVQSFEKSSFYLTLSDKANDADVVAQTRAFMQIGAVPYHFNPSQSESPTCTRWTSLADPVAMSYYLLNPLNMSPAWVKFKHTEAKCARLRLISVVNIGKVTAGVDNHPNIYGDITDLLIECDDPFAYRR
ncbi:linear amide C-N hydrolase [Shewanella sp. Scap07]|uniref:linear amide C-N hydrolase n=1 Tax=Shewanella sp. Scap07 TaxID=2589987 RepID=UPI00356A53E9